MAYDNELYNIVDLIDILSNRCNNNLKKVLINRYLNNMNQKYQDQKLFETLFKKRIDLEFGDNEDKLKIINQSDSSLSKNDFLSQDINLFKPNSDNYELNDLNDFSQENRSYPNNMQLESNKVSLQNLFEVRRTHDILKNLKDDKLDFQNNLNMKMNKYSNNKNSQNKTKVYSSNSAKEKFNMSKRKITVYDPEIIFYTKKLQSVVAVNQFEKRKLSKSLESLKNFYYVKNIEKIDVSKAITQNFYKIKSANLNYPSEKKTISTNFDN